MTVFIHCISSEVIGKLFSLFDFFFVNLLFGNFSPYSLDGRILKTDKKFKVKLSHIGEKLRCTG